MPDRVKVKRSTYRKAIYFMKACFYTGIFTLVYALVAGLMGVREPIYMMLGITLGFWSLPFIFSVRLRFIIACNIYILLGTSVLTYTALYTGGFHSPILY